MAENQNPTDAPRTWKVGDVIADLYEVTGVLGEGAFGIVHKVHHRGWNMDLAVKSPKEEILWNENAVRRFLREAETWVTLGLYPHVASCYYVRVLGGLPRMFIEYADGGTLRDWQNDGKVKDWHTILDIAIQICYGLSFAHKKGLVHRDLKPGNCLMMSDGTLKLTDFGLVKALGDMTGTASVTDRVPRERGLDRNRVPELGLTAAGRMGTPEYMAPEQWSNPAMATAAADIWAFGVMFYELTCGKRPFEMQPDEPEDAFYARMVKSNWAHPSPRELRSDMPRRQEEIIARCLSPKVEERPQDVEVIAAEIDQLYSDLVDVMPPVRSKPSLPFMQSELDATLPLVASARRPPPEIPSLADTLNNQAVSLLDLGREEEALSLLDESLKDDPTNVHATFNRSLVLWRKGRITDIEALRNMTALREIRPQDHEVPFFIGLCHIERGDAESALRELEEARRLIPVGSLTSEARNIDKALERAGRMRLAGESGECLRAFEGHTGEVISVCVSPDGRHGLSVGGDKTLRMWELSTGKCLRVLDGSTWGFDWVSISPDCRYALSGGGEKTLRLWELSTWKCLRTFEGDTETVCLACISPDDRYGLSWKDKTLRLWELATGKCLRTFEDYTGWVGDVCFSPDGQYWLLGGEDHTLRLWDLATCKCLRTFEGHTGPVNSVSISSDGRHGLSGSGDETLRLWDLATGKCLRTFEGHTDEVNSVCISADGRYGLSGGHDRTLRLWELSTGKCLRTVEGHAFKVNSVCFSPDSEYGLSGGWDKALRLWTLGTGEAAAFSIARPRLSGRVSDDEATFRSLIADGEHALSKGELRLAVDLIQQARQLSGHERSSRALNFLSAVGKTATKVGMASAWTVKELRGRNEHIASVCISPDCRYGLSGGAGGSLLLWELATGKCVRSFEGHTNEVVSACISPDGRHALSGSEDSTLRLWELATGTCLRTFPGHNAPVFAVCISPDGQYGLSGGIDKTLRLQELASGKCVQTFVGHTDWVLSVSISSDGRNGLSGGQDKTLRLWDLATGRCLRTFEGHTDSVESVCISSDGRDGLSGSKDKTLRLWELATGKCLRTLVGHTDWVHSVSISSDGRYGLSGGHDRTLRLWELTTGNCLRTLEGHTGDVRSVCFSPDSRYGLSGCEDKTLRLWEFDWEYEFPEPKDWDEGVRPYLEIFLTLHMRVGLDGISRVGRPAWKDEDFRKLLVELGYRGYGWLRPEGVRRQLEKMARVRKGPPGLGGK